jgi:hypothetical protein
MDPKPSTNNFKFWPSVKEEKSLVFSFSSASKSSTQMGSLCVKKTRAQNYHTWAPFNLIPTGLSLKLHCWPVILKTSEKYLKKIYG